jgi:hypothetical protein
MEADEVSGPYGVTVKIAQEQLGHPSISTTVNIYTHVVDASHRKAIEAVERELFPTVPKPDDRVNEEEIGSAEDSERFGGAPRI